MKRAALTFDDGPSEWTSPLLDVLRAHDAHATFFVLGKHVAHAPKITARIIAGGHELGVHGWDHKPVDAMGNEEIMVQLADTCEQITLATETVLRWWRPPWHRVTPDAAAVAERLGLSYCSTTVEGYDVNRVSDQIVKSVYDEIGNGSIIGLHDGIAANGNQMIPHRKNTISAVSRILGTLSREWEFVTVSELLR